MAQKEVDERARDERFKKFGLWDEYKGVRRKYENAGKSKRQSYKLARADIERKIQSIPNGVGPLEDEITKRLVANPESPHSAPKSPIEKIYDYPGETEPRPKPGPKPKPDDGVTIAPVHKDLFAGKREISMRKAVEWVFENLPLGALNPEDCPSAGAWGLYQLYRINIKTRAEFYNTFASKLLPSQNQLRVEDMRKDTGERVDDWINENLLDVQESVPPRYEEESSLSAEDVEFGSSE